MWPLNGTHPTGKSHGPGATAADTIAFSSDVVRVRVYNAPLPSLADDPSDRAIRPRLPARRLSLSKLDHPFSSPGTSPFLRAHSLLKVRLEREWVVLHVRSVCSGVCYDLRLLDCRLKSRILM